MAFNGAALLLALAMLAVITWALAASFLEVHHDEAKARTRRDALERAVRAERRNNNRRGHQ